MTFTYICLTEIQFSWVVQEGKFPFRINPKCSSTKEPNSENKFSTYVKLLKIFPFSISFYKLIKLRYKKRQFR